jgi:threonine aldolase
VALGCTPADLSWKRGLDLLTFGSAKNGTFSAEALIIFDADLMDHARYLHKRMAQLSSKMRFQSAQMLAYLEDDLWLANARHANAMARRLADGLVASGIGRLEYPAQANMIFWQVPASLANALEARGHDLVHHDAGDDRVLRLVCAFDVTEADVDGFLHEVAEALPASNRQAS